MQSCYDRKLNCWFNFNSVDLNSIDDLKSIDLKLSLLILMSVNPKVSLTFDFAEFYFI